MKKVLFTSFIAVLFLTAFSSCSRCQTCTKSSSDTVRVCEKNYDSKTGYGIALDGYEALGYNCH
jgi:hypothetical protein